MKERHGKGKNTFQNGDIYEGSYVSGQRNGSGVYKWKATGARYIGEYSKNLKHGQGTMVYPDGSRYKGNINQSIERDREETLICFIIGSFEENKRSGFGSYTYANGDVYEGMWKNDLKNGDGE